MKHIRRICVLVLAVAAFFGVKERLPAEIGTIVKASEGAFQDEFWNPLVADSINNKEIAILVDGEEVISPGSRAYMNDTMDLLIPEAIIREAFDCIVTVGNDGQAKIVRNDLVYTYGAERVQEREGQYYFLLEEVAQNLDYSYMWESDTNTAVMESLTDEVTGLPVAYDYREEGRQPQVRDQGLLGTCWAFASLTALESTRLPGESIMFSPDHMSINNSFGLTQDDGGEYTMSIAYLTSWQGPVLEEDDPYGDEYSPEGLEAVKHVQEVQIIDDKNYEEIKKAVYKYGGVQTSIHNSLQNSYSQSPDYNQSTYAYCYQGDAVANHEVVIIGWDDRYPKENFNGTVEEDGAFICQNSWGSNFGEGGVFYISYSDVIVGMNCVVYSVVEETDNYDSIYQADLAGWTGQLGYGRNTAWFANVYTAEETEAAQAAGFYATKSNTEYKVYVVADFEDTDSMDDRVLAAEGKLRNKGYYTIPFDVEIQIEAGKKFAVIVEITTPETEYPVAVEYAGEEIIKQIDLSDGEGYISANGIGWESTEEKYSCNICLKVYTNK